MRPDEYRSLIKRLETHYQEFLQTSKGSEMFGDDEKKSIQGHFEKAQGHYETLVIQLPTYSEFRQPLCSRFYSQAVSNDYIAASCFLMSSKLFPDQWRGGWRREHQAGGCQADEGLSVTHLHSQHHPAHQPAGAPSQAGAGWVGPHQPPPCASRGQQLARVHSAHPEAAGIN